MKKTIKKDIRAKLTLHDVSELHWREIDKIAEWLRDQATNLVGEREKYSKRFTATLYK